MVELIDIAAIRKAYFIGIGGIGMSAIARFFHSAGAHYFPTVVNYREKKASLLGKFALGPGGHSWRV